MTAKIVFYVVQLLEGIGMGSFFPIYTPWLELHGLNFLKMGVVNFFYHIAATVLDPFTGFIADRFGKRETFVVGQILWTATQYIYGASSNISGFMLAEGVAAVGHSLKSDALESWLQNIYGKAEANKVIGQSKILFNLGEIATSILAGYISAKYGMQIAWYVSGTCFLVATVFGGASLYIAGTDISKRKDKQNATLTEIFVVTFANKTITSGMILLVVYSFASKPVFMYWPQIVSGLGMPENLIGWSILAMSLPSLVGSVLAGHNILYTRTRNGIYMVLVTLGIGLAVAGLAKELKIFFVGLSILEIAYGAIKIVLYGYIHDEVPDDHRSTVNSITSSVSTFGGAISLLVMGAIADAHHNPQIALTVGSVSVILSLIIAYIVTKSNHRNRLG